MTALSIDTHDLTALKGKVVIVTGGSSGIGLATTKLLLDLGALVISGDISKCPIEHQHLTSLPTNVTDWAQLSALFDGAKSRHGRIDHVFANVRGALTLNVAVIADHQTLQAGITSRTTYLEDRLDSQGNLLEPDHSVIDINLKSVVNTAYLALHHFRHQEPSTGSIVCTASVAAVQRFRVVDYTAAKHGVLGLVRGLVPALASQKMPVRVNAVAPHWTSSGMVPAGMLEAIGQAGQGPEAVAKSACLLMADDARQGQLIHSCQGKFWEIGQRLNEVTDELTGPAEELEGTMSKIMALATQHAGAA